MKRNTYDITCNMCESKTLVEVINEDEAPEHCPMCGHPIDLSSDYDEDDDY